MKALKNQGDTIVEVLIVLAVLGFAISISYASASRSLADAEQSEENSYAAELAQTQVEEIRSMVLGSTEAPTGSISGLASIPVSPGPPPSQQFCMNGGTASPSICQLQNNGNGVTYTVTDTLTQTQNTNPANDMYIPYVNSFEVAVTWPDIQGQGTDEVTLYYNAYPPPS